jgi:hypothetical protein
VYRLPLIACLLVLALPSSAGGNPRLAPPMRPSVTWTLLAAGNYRGRGPLRNRIYYARTAAQAARWLFPVRHDRQLLRHLNFTKYGVLAIYHLPVGCRRLSLQRVMPFEGGILTAELLYQDPSGHVCVVSTPYILARIEKNSLSQRVSRLHILEHG